MSRNTSLEVSYRDGLLYLMRQTKLNESEESNMTKQQSQWNAKAEAVMMGMTQLVESNEEAIYIADYIARTLGFQVTGQEIFDQATQYSKGAEIKAVNISAIMDMRMLALPMKTDEDEEEFDLFNVYGALSYVYNFDAPFCSELGYAYFEKRDNGIKRIG